MCGIASVSLSNRSYATLLIVLNDPGATPFPITVQTLLPIHVDRSTQSLPVIVTISSNKITMWESQIHLMFPLNCQLLFTTSMSVSSRVEDIHPMSHCHRDADYPGDAPDVPRRSLRQVKKPKWLADYDYCLITLRCMIVCFCLNDFGAE